MASGANLAESKWVIESVYWQVSVQSDDLVNVLQSGIYTFSLNGLDPERFGFETSKSKGKIKKSILLKNHSNRKVFLI